MLYYKATAGCGVGFLLLGVSILDVCATERTAPPLCTLYTAHVNANSNRYQREESASGVWGRRTPGTTGYRVAVRVWWCVCSSNLVPPFVFPPPRRRTRQT